MKDKKENKSRLLTTLLVIPGILLTLNLLAAIAVPGYSDIVSKVYISKLDRIIDGTVLLDRSSISGPVANQAGINLQKTRDNAKGAKALAEGGDKEAAAAVAAEPKEGAAATAPAAGAAGKKGKAKKKAPVKIDPEMMKKAFAYFEKEIQDRDAVAEGQNDTEKPYVSKAWRDNPFDEVQEIDIDTPKLGQSVPPPPYYPPKGESKEQITSDEFKKYVGTVKLNGVIVINDKFMAFIDSGNKKYIKSPGEDYKDKFDINVDDVTLDAVVISDEFGHKGLLEYDFRRGFEVQSIDNATYITNLM